MHSTLSQIGFEENKSNRGVDLVFSSFLSLIEAANRSANVRASSSVLPSL